MTWKYPGQLAKRFVAPVPPPVQRKLSWKFHTSIIHLQYLSSRLFNIFFVVHKYQCMITRYPFHEIISEVLTEVFESLLKKSISELPLTFTTSQEKECIYYVVTDDREKSLVLLYFSFNKLGFEERLTQFLQVVKKQRSKHDESIRAGVIGIGLWELTRFREFRNDKIGFHMMSDSHIIDTFKWYDFEVDENLTMDIDNYIRYQNWPEDEKIELADVLLEGVHASLIRLFKSIVIPPPQTPITSHPS